MRLLTTLCLMLSLSLSTMAMDLGEARDRAWFLTDKMAYELNLTPEQYECVYQVNLEYFLRQHTPSDCYGALWDFREADLRAVLFDWQYRLYTTVSYFFRPLRWVGQIVRLCAYERYRPGYYYFRRPAYYTSSYGGLWNHRSRRDPSPYRDRHFRPGAGLNDHYHHGSAPGGLGRPEYGRPGRSDRGEQPGRPDRTSRPEYGRPGGSERAGGGQPGGRPQRGGYDRRDGWQRGEQPRERTERGSFDRGFSQGRTGGERPSTQRSDRSSRSNNTDGNRSTRTQRRFGR